MFRYGSALRRAAVAQFEVRLRVADNSGAWRLVVSSPTGPLFHQLPFKFKVANPARHCILVAAQMPYFHKECLVLQTSYGVDEGLDKLSSFHGCQLTAAGVALCMLSLCKVLIKSLLDTDVATKCRP